MSEPTTQQIGDAGRQWCSSAWLDDPPEQTGWYWMDYGMWTPIFPAFWNGHSWENSGGVRLNVEQFEKAQWQGPIFPVGREMNKSSNDQAEPRPGEQPRL